MSITQSAVVKYLENKGYQKAVKAYRQSSGFGKDAANPSITLTRMYNFYYDLNEEEEEKVSSNIANENSSFDDLKRKYSTQVDSSENERCFLGNMPFKINEKILKESFADCGEITSVEWLSDKHTGQFYGSGFVVFDSVESARKAVAASGRLILNRPVKVNFAPLAKPEAKESTHRKMPPAPLLSAKPADCRTIFLGNLSFEVTEDHLRQAFGKCGEIYEVRFLYRKDGDFKGCAFVEFFDTYAIDEAIKLHRTPICGRPVRVDYA